MGITHIAQLDHASRLESLHCKGTEGTVMSTEGAHDGSRNGGRVHARLETMRHGDECPVGDDSVDTLHSLSILLDDEILSTSSIEELDVGQLENLAQDRRSEQSSVLDDDVSSFVFVRAIDLVEQRMCRLAYHHGRHQLTAEPAATAGSDTGFEQGDAQVRSCFCESVAARQTSRASAEDDDVAHGGIHHILVVAAHRYKSRPAIFPSLLLL